MTVTMETLFKEISFGSEDYCRAYSLREEVLRKPLGLTFTTEDMMEEKFQMHFALTDQQRRVLATVIAVPLSAHTAKLRQMAVAPAHQGGGLGSRLLKLTEGYLRRFGFAELCLHARCAALGFYEKQGYQSEGTVFTEVGIPHRKMSKMLIAPSLKSGVD